MTETPVRDRVQIVPLGFEYARLRDPIFRWKADVVVAIEHAESDRAPPYLAELCSELEENERIELDRRSCDVFGLYDALATISEAIVDYEGDDVYVNLSGGSKITAIAGMIACMASGAAPIYARPEYAGGERIPDTPTHEEVGEIFELPTYPIDRPTETQLAFLARIEAGTSGDDHGRYRGTAKTELIDFAIDRGFEFVARSETSSRKGYYRLLDRHVIDPLTARGYVELEQVGRRKFVALTTEGENVLRGFRYVLD